MQITMTAIIRRILLLRFFFIVPFLYFENPKAAISF
jgi:hypothetical protein